MKSVTPMTANRYTTPTAPMPNRDRHGIATPPLSHTATAGRRHTAAALLWAAGASDLEVQLILGHAETETSKRLYAHLLQGSGDSVAARVEQLREARRAS